MGVGSRLMEHVLRLAKDAKIPTYLEATHLGSLLYAHLGFGIVEMLKLRVADDHILEYPAMIKNPVDIGEPVEEGKRYFRTTVYLPTHDSCR
jgi:GNAT superfamily N-acetyltransferase